MSSSESINDCIVYDDLLSLVKSHAKICNDVEDNLINLYLNAAISYIKLNYNIYIKEEEVTDTVDISISNCCNWVPMFYQYKHYIEKRYADSIVSVKLGDIDADYVYDSALQYVKVTMVPDKNTLHITYNVGYDCIPTNVVEAILLLTTYYYDNRVNASAITLTQIPDNIKMLLPFNFISSI